MLSCLDGLIGIKNCSQSDGCEAFINSLPGITLESIVSATEDDQKTYLLAWDDIVNEAKSVFRLDVTGAIIECRAPSAECDYDKVICGNKKILFNAWKYRLAVTLLEFRLFSTRINRFTLFGKDEARELHAHYLEKYNESLIRKAHISQDR